MTTSPSPFDRLVAVVRRLRAPDGCPWDRAQTADTLRPALLEEAYEVVDAIDRGASQDLREELGDLLFGVLLVAQIEEEAGAFTVDAVIEAITAKMIRRHPHVFGSPAERAAAPSWAELKRAERRATDIAAPSALDGIPMALPALRQAWRVSGRAADVGFDWPDTAGVRAKLDEELAELDAAMASGDAHAVADELGDVLFTVVNLARHLRADPEDALRAGTAKFSRRFRCMEGLAAPADVATLTSDALESLWMRAKEQT